MFYLSPITTFLTGAIPGIMGEAFGINADALEQIRIDILKFIDEIQELSRIAGECSGLVVESEFGQKGLDVNALCEKARFLRDNYNDLSSNVSTRLEYLMTEDALEVERAVAKHVGTKNVGRFELSKVYKLVSELAESGDRKMWVPQAILLQYGWGVQRDYEEAAKLFNWAKRAGDARGLRYLEKLYMDGWCPSKHPEVAHTIMNLKKVARRGDGGALVQLGLMFYHGMGVEQDTEKAIEYFSDSTIKNSPIALYYFLVLVVKKNVENHCNALKEQQWQEFDMQVQLLRKNIEFFKLEYKKMMSYASRACRLIFLVLVLGFIVFLLMFFYLKLIG